jgi:ABC-2 type transport system permease protein
MAAKTYIGQWFRDIWNIFTNELNLVLHDSGVLLIFLFAGLVYPVLYNCIYGHGTVDEMPVAVVDLSHGEAGRRYISKLDATRECSVAYDCAGLAEAQALMAQGKVHGIVCIPEDFDAALARGDQGVISTYADMSTFLYYKNLTLATNLVMLDELQSAPVDRYVSFDNHLPYNQNISFTLFFVYMAMFMILQQVMFYGSATLAGTIREEKRDFVSLTGNLSGLGMGRVSLGRGAAYFIIFLLLGLYGAVLVPHWFQLPMHAGWQDILVLLLFFVADIIFFSFTFSAFIDRRETVLVMLLFVTPIAVFLTGFTWPQASFPAVWRCLSYVFPSTFGCRAYMVLSQTGTLASIAPEIRAMTAQTMVYFLLATACNRLASRQSREA